MPSAPLPLPARLPPALLAVVAWATLLGAGGCGDGTASETVTAGPGGSTATTVVLLRTGGLAGYDDELAVAGDGTVSGSTRAGVVSCAVPPATSALLATAPAPSVASVEGADRMAVTVRRDGVVVGLGEAQGADPLSTTARALLDDVQQPQAERTVCR